jgi:cell wall-associated NlpC family hydrolase
LKSRATSRHRASVRSSTPFTTLTNTVNNHAGMIGRGGVVIAMSSGLVATMGLPAQALTKAAPEAAAPATAPIAVQPALSLSSGLLAAPAAMQSSAAPLTAPAAATVTFDSDAFKAVPAAPVPSAAAGATGTTGVRSDLSSAFGSARGSSVLAIAARYVGVAYRYGGTTPAGWDCSGAVGYIYGQLGYHLPRTANQQMLASTRISRSQARAGDLVFMTSGGSAYHVGIYAGGNMFYDAGKTGSSFSKRAIWTSDVVFGRISS